MMAKVQIVTGDTAPVWKWLQKQSLNGVANAPVSWNFNKYLIDENGHWVRHFSQNTLPTDTAITNWILSPPIVNIGINERNNPQIKLVSNPVSQNISIAFPLNLKENVSLSLNDVQGREIYASENISITSAGKFNLATESIPNGIYNLRLTGKSFNNNLKVVVDK